MKGSENKLLGFMEGADKRFIIPVYQRKYDWKYEQCCQLYEDLKKVIFDGRHSHFFGSIVAAVVPNGRKTEYHIIDGQQRLTTISLLLLAIRNLARRGKITSSEEGLDKEINDRFLVDPWCREENPIKLRPVRSDRTALEKLFGDEEDFEPDSNLTINYRYFCDMLAKEEVPVNELYQAIGKLEIISITLDPGDDAQRIFESLNSTGLALEEGDKIRNYVLMGLPAQEQTRYYDTYWTKIETCTGNDVSGFVRDYLSIKQQVTPTMSAVYKAFKAYAEKTALPIEELLKDLLYYARLFEKLLVCRSGLKSQELDDCLYRFKRLEIVVTRPFFMEVLRLHQDGKLTADEVLQIFLITENYLFRRNICDVPTNALNKIFLTLNREILRYDNTADHYVSKFKYALLSKKESGRFPSDEEFAGALAVKQVYQMRGKYKAYLFERFENYGTIENKNVYEKLDNNSYTIEHIMPQHLTPAWVESLGEHAEEIHETWLHRLANLTLTGYNPSLSNNTFAEKRDAKTGGYRDSGFRMNQKIAHKESWGLPELEERSREMVAYAKEIWAYPQTDYQPAEKEFESCTLDDENADLTGRDIVKYRYQNAEQPVSSWTDMFEHVIKFLHQQDKSVLTDLAYGQGGQVAYISHSPDQLRNAMKIEENIYVEKNIRTGLKLGLLRRLFALFGADPMDLVFYLKDEESGKDADASRHEMRRRYWTYALPLIKEKHLLRGTFKYANPVTSNAEPCSFGIDGFFIRCIANYDEARVDLYMGSGDVKKNKDAYDRLKQHQGDIERALGVSLCWERGDTVKASWVSYSLQDVSITQEADWPRMAKFHAEWSDAFCRVMLPYLQDTGGLRAFLLAEICSAWASQRKEAHVNPAKSSTTLIRFTTEGMTQLLPDIPHAPSGWGTDNHYFYEIENSTGDQVRIKLVLSARNGTEDFLAACDRITRLYAARKGKERWQWRIPFSTKSVSLDKELSEEKIYAALDACMEEVLAFERDLAPKLAQS